MIRPLDVQTDFGFAVCTCVKAPFLCETAQVIPYACSKVTDDRVRNPCDYSQCIFQFSEKSKY